MLYFVTDNIEKMSNIPYIFDMKKENNKFILTINVKNYDIPTMNWINEHVHDYKFSIKPKENMESELVLTIQYMKPVNRVYTSELYNYLDDYEEIYILEKYQNETVHTVKFLILKYTDKLRELLLYLTKWKCSCDINKLLEKLDNPKEFVDKGLLTQLQVAWNSLADNADKDYVISTYNQIFSKYVELTNRLIQ